MEKQGNLLIGKHLMMAFLFCFSLPLFAGEFEIAMQDTTPADAKVKTGWTFGALPAVSFNTDLGFQYGGLVNLYHFGDGSTYPKYKHSIYAEVSRYTKGSGINRLFYDSEYLIPNIRVTSDLSYFTEKAIDFYGFNGYNAVYNPAWEDSDDPDYISRMFYRHERNMFRFIADFQGPIIGRELRWVAGLGILKNSVDDVDIESLNKGKKDEDLLPTNVPGLFDKYVEWGIIGENEKSGGWSNHLKLGLVYDTRDNEPNPWKGIWSEVVIFAAPSVFGNGDFGYSRVSATHRQYFTVVPNRLSFAYRLNFLGTITGDVPFYMYPYQINSFSASSNTDGIGGSKTVRGMLRNRVVGDAMAFGNFEFRWRFYRTVLFNQNIYLALSTFSDMGKVLKEIDFQVPANVGEFPMETSLIDFFLTEKEELHVTYGAGFRIVMNENFIVAVDYGMPLDNRDGKGGLYIGLNFLF
jgi:outer membrane protein assembly factor BamA